MAAVSDTIVREYFELHGFFVRQQRKYTSPTRQEDDEIDFCVVNPHHRPAADPLPFVLTSAHLEKVAHAVVAVKGWHSDIFSVSLLANAPEIFRFLDRAVLQQAARSLGHAGPFTKILVVPALPSTDEPRQLSIEFLRGKGLDAVISFETMLSDLIEKIEVNRNYQKSDLLQIIRILKNYGFLREPQMELFKAKRHAPRKGPAVNVAVGPTEPTIPAQETKPAALAEAPPTQVTPQGSAPDGSC